MLLLLGKRKSRNMKNRISKADNPELKVNDALYMESLQNLRMCNIKFSNSLKREIYISDQFRSRQPYILSNKNSSTLFVPTQPPYLFQWQSKLVASVVPWLPHFCLICIYCCTWSLSWIWIKYMQLDVIKIIYI
jgi:hypothetical protein